MVESIKGQFLDWQYGREIVKSFVKQLSNSELDKSFPRKTLNSVRKQCEELIQIQSCYVRALEKYTIFFEYDSLSDTSKDGLLQAMYELDTRLEQILEHCTGDETIKWFGEEWIIHRHLSAMIGHEQMHIGQIIGFCYAIGIEIPESIANTMSLTG